MGKVFSYIRFSSAKQSAGDSYARQVKAAKAFCDENGLELAAPREYLFFDAGRSAFKGKHLDDTGELARFLSFVEDGTIPAGSYLVVESLDRLSREKVRDTLPRFLDLLAKGINVYTSVDKRLYTKDYNELDLIISIISMSRAHEESATKGGRVSSAWRAKQKEARTTGKPLGKLRPLWLDVTPDGYVLNPANVAVVRRIFELSTKGHGSRIIAATLNQEGIPAFSAGRKNFSGLWGFSTVRHILDSRAVLGEYQPHIFIDGKRTPDGEPVKRYFPAVVTEDEYYLAQAARSSRKTHTITKTTTNFNVLAGILNCYKCGALMHLQGQRGRKYYKCSKTAKGMCDAGIISAPRTEAVFKEILTKVDSLSLVQDSSGSLQKSLQILEGRIAELKGKQEDAEASHTEFPSRITAKLLHELEASIGALEIERTTLTEQLTADKVISKENFFEKLDLVSFEGRVAANNLIKRLGLHIFANKHGRTDETYWVSKSNAIPTPFSDEAANLLFYLIHKDGNIRFEAMYDEYVDLQVIQGELTEGGAILTKTDSWDDLPTELLEALKSRHGEPK
ncbi:recombinase family protein [Pseudomonas chlororaphis subsp. aurantiaca]|uniref:recombinase family protein n=1 Tax=Pseudomonas chlororaphis TaxID=587753 RepID=UPI0027DCF154|nr:recombinase family protein [Pseudomonas chlororaphis]WMJ01204.1 recombinase family protein [Pseudomonas chlororaphis subsp. aurantiaca]